MHRDVFFGIIGNIHILIKVMNYYFFFLFQVIFSTILGGAIGWQRLSAGKEAGMRTYALVALGSTLFTILSVSGFQTSDPARIAAQILTGIGFIGAGTILHKKNAVEGLTTAAGLWAAAAVGMAVGVGWFYQAAIVGIVIFLVLLIKDKSPSQKS